MLWDRVAGTSEVRRLARFAPVLSALFHGIERGKRLPVTKKWRHVHAKTLSVITSFISDVYQVSSTPASTTLVALTFGQWGRLWLLGQGGNHRIVYSSSISQS